MFYYPWMPNVFKPVLAGILFVIGYIAYWAIRNEKVLGSKKVFLVRKPEPEDYGTPVAPI
jgi:hypothetical protein